MENKMNKTLFSVIKVDCLNSSLLVACTVPELEDVIPNQQEKIVGYI